MLVYCPFGPGILPLVSRQQRPDRPPVPTKNSIRGNGLRVITQSKVGYFDFLT